jgi:hypothetical protein
MAFGNKQVTDKERPPREGTVSGRIPAAPVFSPPTASASPASPGPARPAPASTPVGQATGEAIETAKAKRNYRRDPLAPVPLDILQSAEDVPEAEWANRPITSGPERSAMQTVIDAKVKALHVKWTEAGKPDLAHSPRSLYRVGPEHAPSIVRMLASAGNHFGIQVKADRQNEPSGKVAIVFTARDRRPKTVKPAGMKSDVASDGSVS